MKLTLTRGLPASGKSTWAKEQLNKGGETIRVNRDDLRQMLFNSHCLDKREDTITEIQRSIVSDSLALGKSVILDDTNLNDKTFRYWEDFASLHGLLFVVKDFTGVPLEVCVARDELRSGFSYVGRPTIEKMALKYGLIDWDKFEKGIKIFDMDGTLADVEHRRKFANGPAKDWDRFFAEAVKDTVREGVAREAREAANAGYGVVVVSARPARCYRDTAAWLDKANIKFNHIFMRPDNNKTDDVLIKSDILKYLPLEKIREVYDDRPKVLREVWLKHLPADIVIDVGTGEEF